MCARVCARVRAQASLREASARAQRGSVSTDVRAVAAVEAQMCEQQAELVRRQRKRMVPEVKRILARIQELAAF